MKKVTNYKTAGITLISLVVTVIVLLILAGVTINLTLGNNGIFNTAQKATKNYTNAQEKELANLDNFENTVSGVIQNVDGEENQTPTYETLASKAKPGDYVKYDTGTAGIKTFRVLYDATSPYGVQIISDKNLENITLGGEDWTTARDSYNNAISTLNTAAMKYLNTTYATDARCVGSNPADKNAENKGPVQLQFTTTVEGANNMKDDDKNYTTDQTAMKAAEIWTTGEEYWLASRIVPSGSSDCWFGGRHVDDLGEMPGFSLCRVWSDGRTYVVSLTHGLRSCISLKSGLKVTAGDGRSEATAFELSI